MLSPEVDEPGSKSLSTSTLVQAVTRTASRTARIAQRGLQWACRRSSTGRCGVARAHRRLESRLHGSRLTCRERSTGACSRLLRAPTPRQHSDEPEQQEPEPAAAVAAAGAAPAARALAVVVAAVAVVVARAGVVPAAVVVARIRLLAVRVRRAVGLAHAIPAAGRAGLDRVADADDERVDPRVVALDVGVAAVAGEATVLGAERRHPGEHLLAADRHEVRAAGVAVAPALVALRRDQHVVLLEAVERGQPGELHARLVTVLVVDRQPEPDDADVIARHRR